jgi:hypothetical protein
MASCDSFQLFFLENVQYLLKVTSMHMIDLLYQTWE